MLSELFTIRINEHSYACLPMAHPDMLVGRGLPTMVQTKRLESNKGYCFTTLASLVSMKYQYMTLALLDLDEHDIVRPFN